MDYGKRLRTHIDPRATEPITPPRHAVATSELYDGTTAGIPVVAIARVPGYICVRQKLEAEVEWIAWLPADRVRPA